MADQDGGNPATVRRVPASLSPVKTTYQVVPPVDGGDGGDSGPVRLKDRLRPTKLFDGVLSHGKASLAKWSMTDLKMPSLPKSKAKLAKDTTPVEPAAAALDNTDGPKGKSLLHRSKSLSKTLEHWSFKKDPTSTTSPAPKKSLLSRTKSAGDLFKSSLSASAPASAPSNAGPEYAATLKKKKAQEHLREAAAAAAGRVGAVVDELYRHEPFEWEEADEPELLPEPVEQGIEHAYFSDAPSREALSSNPGDGSRHQDQRVACTADNYRAEIERRVLGRTAVRDFAYPPSDPRHWQSYGLGDGQR